MPYRSCCRLLRHPLRLNLVVLKKFRHQQNATLRWLAQCVFGFCDSVRRRAFLVAKLIYQILCCNYFLHAISVLVSEISTISDISNTYHESTANKPTHKKYMCIFIEIFSKRMSAPQIYKSTPLHFKDIDTVQGIVQGYFANFGTVDSDGDIFTPDCFNKSIIENGPKSQKPRIKHLLDHDRRNAVAVLQELYADATGLAYVSKAGSHTAGQDFLKMCMDGIITEHSVGINYIFDKIKVQEDGSTLLLEVRLWEGSSLQTWGANQNTPLTGVKSLEQAEDYILTLQKALKKGTYTDETFVQLQKLHDTISEIIKSNTTEPPVTQPTAAVFDKNKFLHELSNALK